MSYSYATDNSIIFVLLAYTAINEYFTMEVVVIYER